MRTIQYENTWTGSSPYSSGLTVMEVKVQNNRGISIHCVSDDAGMVVKTQYVFTDPGTGAVVLPPVDYDTLTMSAAGTLYVLNYQYKIDYLRIVATSSTAGTKTLRITANVEQS